MHPAVLEWWKERRRAHFAGCAPMGGHRGGPWHGHREAGPGPGDELWGEGGDGGGGGGFGVRRPLRFLAYKLGLDEKQVTELARVLDELKTERAQAEVDRRRTLAAFADSLGAESFDEARATEAGNLRVASATRLRDAVTTALRRIHTLLAPDQREKLAYLIRTGTLVI